MELAIVDLPLPERPTKATDCPAFTSKLTLFNAGCSAVG